MPTADHYHGKEGVLQIEYPDRIQYKDVTQSTNDHYAFTDAAAAPDADPETSLAGSEYSNANYQTVGVNDTSHVDKNTATNTYYAMHYFKITMPTTEANITRIDIRVHGASDQEGALTDGWNLKIWDSTANAWDDGATTTENTEQVLSYSITDSSTTTISDAIYTDTDDFLIFCAQAADASNGASDSNMNIYFVEILVWYARTIAAVKNWDASVLKEIEHIYSQGSTLRQDHIQRALSVDCNFSRISFDGVLMSEILGSVDMDQDINGATSAGRTRASLKDSAETLDVTFRGTLTSGSNSIKIRVDNIPLEGLNVTAREESWIQQDFTGTGNTFYLERET